MVWWSARFRSRNMGKADWLQPKDLLVFFTDGITEPENAYGEMFGEERLTELLIRARTLTSLRSSVQLSTRFASGRARTNFRMI